MREHGRRDARRAPRRSPTLRRPERRCSGAHRSRLYLDDAEVFDLAAGTWSRIGSMLTARAGHTATPLPGMQMLVTGGEGREGSLRETEVFRPMPNGSICEAPIECQSGSCADGVC
ncbi:kelch repeat-containing protein [Sorangium sp. So ce861]|uniref:kelch repeat-containing protein n=1 Tax=Sorangium sp. So ce861 TaxID=3133323 RepID=UPI003F5F06F8